MTRHFLIPVYGDVEPVMLGPYGDADERDTAAKAYRIINGDEDGIFWLDIPDDGPPKIGAYSGGFFEPS